MSAPVSPSEAREAAAILSAILSSVEPPTGRVGNLLREQDRRVRGALRAAQRALAEPDAGDLDPEQRALAAARRHYRRSP